MQLPLDLKWSQTRNKRSMLWLYMSLALAIGLVIWSIPKLLSLLVLGWMFLQSAENRLLLGEVALTTLSAIGLALLMGRVAVFLWNVITVRIWQVPQRYATAIERLGDEKIEHRLESIRTLKRIAKFAAKDHRAITKTLTNFVQERASVYPRGRTTLSEHHSIASDIQAALMVIGRKPLFCRVMWRFIRKAYRESDQQINMGLTNLCKARLHRANLQKANLYRTNLQRSDLQNTNFHKTNLQGANLKECNLCRANLKEADLQAVDLQKATLYKTNLQQSNLYSANLQGANLGRANLQQTSLQEAHLSEANLYRSNLQGAFLYRANLQETSLEQANLQDAFLSEASLQGANLYKANLQGVTGLTEEQLSQAKLCMTILPDGSISYRDCSELGVCDRPSTVKSAIAKTVQNMLEI